MHGPSRREAALSFSSAPLPPSSTPRPTPRTACVGAGRAVVCASAENGAEQARCAVGQSAGSVEETVERR